MSFSVSDCVTAKRPKTRAGLRARHRHVLSYIVDRLYGYDVFVSYAWRDGRAYAELLAAALEHAPSRRERLHVFLDDHEMAAGSPLQATISRALRRSSVLVLVATPMAIRSGHVAEEVRAFRRLNRNIVPIVPANLVTQLRQPWPLDAGTMPDEATEDRPEACERFILATLRQYIWAEEAADVSTDAPSAIVLKKIRNAVGSLRRARLRSAALVTVAAVFLGLAVTAFLLRNHALTQQERAEQNERQAVSRQLAAQSTAVASTQPDRAMLLALAAGDVADTEEADQALLNAVAKGPPVIAYLRAHTEAVSAILPLAGKDGGILISDMGGMVTRWTPRGQKVDAVSLGGGWINSLVQITDGTIAAGSENGVVSLLDPNSLAAVDHIFDPRIAGQSASVLWRASTSELIVGYSGTDTQPGVVVRWAMKPSGVWVSDSQLRIGANLTSLALSPDEATLAIGTSNGQVALWTFGNGPAAVTFRDVNPPNPRQPEIFIKALAFHPSGKRLAFDDGDGGVQIINLDAFEAEESLTCHRHPNDVYQIAFLGDLLLSVGADAKLRLAAAGVGCTPLATYQATAKSLRSLAVTDAARQVVVTGGGDGSAQVWDLARASASGVITAAAASLPANIAFTSDNRILVLTGLVTDPNTPDPGFVRAYNAADLMPLSDRLPGLRGPATATLFVPGQRPAILGYDGWLTWPDLTSTDYANTKRLPGNAVVWPGELLSVDALRVVIAHVDGRIALHDARTGASLWRRSLWPTGPNVRSAAISPDGTRVAVGAVNGWIQILDGVTGKDIGQPLTGHRLEVTGLSFSQNANRLYSGSTDTQLLSWNLVTRTATPIENREGSVQAIAHTGDGRMIAASSQRGTIALWAHDGTRFLGTLDTGIATPVSALRFDHTGNRLAAASMAGSAEPGKLAVWDVGMGNLRQKACAISSRGFTPEERVLFRVPPAVSPCQP